MPFEGPPYETSAVQEQIDLCELEEYAMMRVGAETAWKDIK
jgi:hypothetical protein